MAVPLWPQVIEPMLSRKASSEIRVTVPQTDTGRWVEYTKATGEPLLRN